jgi:putative hydroxymethylpyrimidine transport system permease protein
MRRWLLPIALIGALIGAWQLAASTGALADALNLDPLFVPSPAEIAESLWQNRSLLAENAWVTLKEIVFGLGCGIFAGILLALAMRLSETVRLAFYPLLVVSQAIPVVALAPILVVLFGFGIGPKLWIIALVCFFPVTVNTLDGLASVDPAATKMMRTLDASRAQTLWRVEVPTALPYFFSGAKIAASISAIAAVFGEYVGAESGLAVLIREDSANLQTARVFAAVAILSAIAVALFALFALAERRVVTWR